MTEQWQELKETITEMRDNDGTGTQQEVCKFLTNYMEILEKQMQQSCEDCISRKAMWKVVHECETHNSPSWVWREMLSQLPSVTPQAKIGRWIRCDILQEYKCSECRVCFRNKSKYCPNCGAKMQEGEE